MPKPEPWNPESGHTLYEDRKLWIDYARELEAQNRHDDEADTLCRNLLCEERDTAEAQRDRYREVVELILRRNRLMNPLICLDMLEDQAHKALNLTK